MKRELVMVVDIAHQFYYSDVVEPTLKDPNQLETLNNNAMDAVRKEHMTNFHKWLFVCNPSLGPKFLHKVQIHYNMNPKPKMLIEKLQMLVSAYVTTE
jgi:hypothetical protein